MTKRKFFKIAVSLTLTIALMFNLLSMTSSAVDLTKVSTYLREKMDEEPTAKHPVSIWLTSPDISAQQTTLQTAVASIQENADVELASTGVSRQVALDNVKANYRASVTQIYSTNNNDFVSSCIDKDDIVFVSRYAPMVIANLTNEEIRNLSRSSEVVSMDYHVEPTLTEPQNIATTSISTELDNTLETMAENLTSYTGAGVKIGVVEVGTPDITQLPQSANITTLGAQITAEENVAHATEIAKILFSIAPNAEYYFYSNFWHLYNGIEQLLDIGVDVINLSRNDYTGFQYSPEIAPRNVYDNVTRWYDHIAYNHYVLVVMAAGNDNSNGVNSPAMSYNNFTVGGITSTSYGYGLKVPSSSYYNGNELASKPDICASGAPYDTSYFNIHGTSFSAARVTGTLALMLEADPQLTYSPELLKAIVTAAVNTAGNLHCIPTIRAEDSTLNYMYIGAGLLDCQNSMIVTINNQSRCSTMTPTSSELNYTLVIPSNNVGKLYRVSLAYSIPVNAINEHLSYDSIAYPIPNLDLAIYSPNNSTLPIATSATDFNNIEIVEFIPQVAGTYTIKISQTLSSTENVYFGVAWHIDN